MNATVNIAELSPETRAQVSYTPAEMRARSILSRMESLSAKLKTLEDDIRLLWIDFDNLKVGETILGCATKKDFCEKKLNRTPRAIQYLLAGQSNPADRPHKETSELSSPRPQPLDAPRTTTPAGAEPSMQTPVAEGDDDFNIEPGDETHPDAPYEAPLTADAVNARSPRGGVGVPEGQSSQTAQLRERFTARYKTFKLSPSENNKYTLTLFDLTPSLVDAIGELLEEKP